MLNRIRGGLRYTASLLALSLLALWGSNVVLAQVAIVGSGWSGGAITSPTSFLDGANFQILNAADTTKILQFSVAGVTTGNTITPFGFGGTAAAPTVTFPAGTAAAPSLNLTGATTTGLWSRGSNIFDISTGGVWTMEFGRLGGVTGIEMASDMLFGWTNSTSAGNTQDLILSRPAPAVMQMGKDVNAIPVDQTLKAHNGITGTDVKGAGLTLEPGIGTGAGVSDPLVINRQITKATGTTAQTYAPAVIVCPSKILSNTSATAQTIASITTTTTTAGGLEWVYTVTASNGTVLNSDAGDINVAWNNNAGTVAATASASLGDVQSNASGTLAATPTVTVATNVISIKYTPTWVTIVPTQVIGYATFTIHSSGDTIACQ